MIRKLQNVLALLLFFPCLAVAQQGAPAVPPASSPAAAAGSTSPASKPAPASSATNPDFLRATDEVLQQMSQILDLPVKEPLKKSLRSREQIRDYLVQQEKEDKEPEKRYADEKTLEAFGLIPRGFPLESFLLDLMTEQIAGLYDPKTREFYIADWISPEDQKPVMAHELTHALDDQYFHIDAWSKAARPNDDAETAREAVLEGSAVAAMFDYVLAPQKMSVRSFPDISVLIGQQTAEETENDPMLQKAPPFIRDDLLFPYMAGATFTQQVLKATSGWGDFHRVFENPPVSTQQILHPELYLAGVKPLPIALPKMDPVLPAGWKELDENVMGEYGVREVLRQYLEKDKADEMSTAWAADRYSISESADKKHDVVALRLRLENGAEASKFFTTYSNLLKKKYPTRTAVQEQSSLLAWQTDIGGAELECHDDECLVVEGADRAFFDRLTHAMGWPAVAAAPRSAVPVAPAAHDDQHAPVDGAETTPAR
jgi:hypothetical protein